MKKYDLYRGMVPHADCVAARRRLLLELRYGGVSAQEIAEWSISTWWPALRYEPEILAVREHLEGYVRREDSWAEPQILVRLPDADGTPLGGSHVDELPPWADGLKYRAIFGVELTDTPSNGGSTILYPASEPVPIPQHTGDVLRFDPDLQHSGSPNFSGSIRMALFFRLLEPA